MPITDLRCHTTSSTPHQHQKRVVPGSPDPAHPGAGDHPQRPRPRSRMTLAKRPPPHGEERALSLLFSDASPRLIHTESDLNPLPRLTLLCLQLIRTTCPGTDLAEVAPFIPPHLRRALVRHAAIHAPLSQIELDALRDGSTHIDTELVVIGPRNTLRASVFGKNDHDPTPACSDDSDSDSEALASWDADADTAHAQDSEPPALRSLAVLSSPLSATTILAFPPTITHLVLINIPRRIPLPWLPTICPLVVLLDLSYNAWLHVRVYEELLMLEEVEWHKLRGLEVLGLRECPVTSKLLLELNRGRWETVRIIQ